MSSFEEELSQRRRAQAHNRELERRLAEDNRRRERERQASQRELEVTRQTEGTSIDIAFGEQATIARDFLGLMRKHKFPGAELLSVYAGTRRDHRGPGLLGFLRLTSGITRDTHSLLFGYPIGGRTNAADGRFVREDQEVIRGNGTQVVMLCQDGTLREADFIGPFGGSRSVSSLPVHNLDGPFTETGRFVEDGDAILFQPMELKELLLSIAAESMPH